MRPKVLTRRASSAHGAARRAGILAIARALGAAVVGLCLVAGCGWNPPPEFELNLEGRPRKSVSAEQREAIAKMLQRLFGTPDRPQVPDGVGLDRSLVEMAAGPPGGDAQGNQRGLYRRHCVTCHGVTGDGAGPSAALLDPYPRDFRRGVFKYTSTKAGIKPLASDLRGTLTRGVAGTAMPSFAQLAPRELDALVEYVKYLSIRGQAEQYLFEQVVDDEARLPLDLGQVLDEGVLPAARSWEAPERNPELVIAPGPRPPVDTPEALAASIARGRDLYASKDAQCVRCHGPQGDGNGEEKELYDDWNKPKKGVTPEQTAELERLYKLPIQRLRPRDFRQGNFRGGVGPEGRHLYYRIYAGIKGTPMPGVGPSPGAPGVMTSEDIWHVVDFVRSLSRK
ncbi:MAG: cytochrome c [Thermoguttaceae bacterium]|nr:cytochrome c [Thermoguttaceae bacterium]